MKTKELLNILRDNSNKKLLFEYAPGRYVAANYHITEVKNITVDSIDCGARPNFWKETVIQLWESPIEKDQKEYMSAYKALSILNKVDKVKPMDRAVEVKFEYGNTNFHTAQLFVNAHEISGDHLIFHLGVAPTYCKAQEICGVEQMEAETTSSCAPGSGCC